MENRDFEVWLSQFTNCISGYDYYINFEKVIRNVENVKIELNILNSLIGSDDIENDFSKLQYQFVHFLPLPAQNIGTSSQIYVKTRLCLFILVLTCILGLVNWYFAGRIVYFKPPHS